MKQTFITVLLFAGLASSCSAQKIQNYSKYKKVEYASDYLKIMAIPVNGPKPHMPAAGADLLPSLLGSVVTLGIDIYNGIHDKRQKSYAATTTNSASFIVKSGDLDEFLNGSYYFKIERYGINSSDDVLNNDNLLESFKIGSIPDDNISKILKLSLTDYKINYSKARYKDGDNLSIGIEIKISAGSSTSASNDKQTKDTTSKGDKKSSKNDDASGANILGDGVIKIPVCNADSAAKTVPATNEIINPLYFPINKLQSEDQVFTITVTVTEANISHLDNSTVNDLMKNHTSDITGLIKAFFPGSSSKSDSKK